MNGTNEALNGLLSGLTSVGNALIEKNYKNRLSDVFNSAIDGLNGYLKPQVSVQDYGRFGVPQVQQPDMNNALQQLFKSQGDMYNKFGEDAKPYMGLLENYFKSNQPQQPEYGFNEINGQLIRYDKNNPNKVDVLFGNPKEEKKKYSVGDYEKMTAEDVKKLGDTEFWDAFKFVSEDVRNELLKNPFVQQEYDRIFKENDFSPKLGGIKRGGKIGSTTTFGMKKDDSKFNALDAYNERIRGGEQLTDTEKENYNTLRLGLGKKYDLNDTQLASVIDRLNGATNQKEKDKILKSLENGSYYEDKGTNQEQIDYDRNRILEWQQAMNDAYNANDGSYDGYKQAFLKELEDFFNRGSITKKEYSDLRKSYY